MLVAIIIRSSIATTIKLSEYSSCSMSGHRFTFSHGSHLGTTAIFAHNTMVDGHIDIAAHWTCGIDAASIKLTDN